MAVTNVTRKIVRIDEDKCDGCGQCVPSCAEGAIQIIDGKARLVADHLCDGLGNCLGQCPRGAITIEERSAEAFDHAAVARHTSAQAAPAAAAGPAHAGGCPGAAARALGVKAGGCPGTMARRLAPAASAPAPGGGGPSRLGHWPVQLGLVPVGGDMWQDADVLIAADCVSFAMPDFHERLLAGKSLAIACPKLDDVTPYVQKLATILAGNTIRTVTVAHMEVPCCSGLVRLVREAVAVSGRSDIPIHDVTVGIDGQILDRW